MSNMKDYMMWLDSRGIANWDTSIGELFVPAGVNVYADELVQEYSRDAEWHHTEPDDDDMIEDDDDEDDFLNDDELGDCIEWSPEEYWCSPDGVLTEEANEMLYTQDSKGELV